MRKLLLLVGITILSLSACTNPDVPAGHEGYVYYTPLLFGTMEFRESLPGPATTGVSWRLSTVNVDMRTRSYKEEFQLFTKENLSVAFEVNTRFQLRPGTVRELVETWGGVDWYNWNVKERLRTIVRVEASKFSALEIQTKTPEVKARIEEQLRARIANNVGVTDKKGEQTPFMIESVDIGEIHFPEEVKTAIERKIATTQELERQEFVLSKVRKDAASNVLGAIRVAKEQLIIASTLDPLYVQQRAIQVYRRVAKSDNQTTIVLPNSANGTALPLILEPKTRRILSEGDKKRIDKELDNLERTFTERLQKTIAAEEKALEKDTDVSNAPDTKKKGDNKTQTKTKNPEVSKPDGSKDNKGKTEVIAPEKSL